MLESRPQSVCTHNLGQDPHIQTSAAQLMR